MNRRTLLLAGASALFAPSLAACAEGEAFSSETVAALARGLAARPYAPPALPPEAPTLGHIGYDQYRDIRFQRDRALFHGESLGFEVQFFPAAYLYTKPVEVFLVEEGRARPLTFGPEYWTWGPLADAVREHAMIPFSGLRVHYPINTPGVADDLVVFQGASYFRALGRGHAYGLSARGLAVKTVFDGAEEFPDFTRFWIERPAHASELVIHALLDGPSVTGAYRFAIRPRESTDMDIRVALFPRVRLANVGLAPLTSMFLADAHDPAEAADFRPAVHDSDGLAILSATGARAWRPLLNPRSMQVSRTPTTDPAGFGLMQRAQEFERYQDLEARYERRPSAWIEPRGRWGQGEVELIELATREEYYDNIVAYWKPARSLEAGARFEYAYGLSWRFDTPAPETRFRVAQTRIGRAGLSRPTVSRYIVDFTDTQPDASRAWVAENGIVGERLASGRAGGTAVEPFLPIAAMLANSGGLASAPVVQVNPHARGVRVSFELDPLGKDSLDLRLDLRQLGRTVSETWVFRAFL